MKDIKELYNNLNIIITKYGHEKELFDKLSKEFKKKNLNLTKAQQVLQKNIPVQVLQGIELAIIADILYAHTKENLIKITDYFTTEEIKTFRGFVDTNKTKKMTCIEFHNVEEVIPNKQYSVPKVSLQYLADIVNDGMFTYNMKTQRDPKRKVYDINTIINEANVDMSKVDEISELMYSNQFLSNLITFNIRKLKDCLQNFEYNSKTKVLKIYVDCKETYFDIIDGFHRLTGAVIACGKANKTNKKLTGSMILSIVHLDENEAQNLVVREDKHTHIKEQHKTSLGDNTDTLIIKHMNDYGNPTTNEMWDKIGVDKVDLAYGNKYTTFNATTLALKHNFSYNKNPREVSKLQDYLIEFMNNTVGYLIHDKFSDDINTLKEQTVLLEENMFVVYLKLASLLKGNNDWRRISEEFLDNINYNRSNKDWEDIGLFKTTKISVVKKISKYIDNAFENMYKGK